jgi:hypothetical protein
MYIPQPVAKTPTQAKSGCVKRSGRHEEEETQMIKVNDHGDVGDEVDIDIDDESERERMNVDVPYKHLHYRQLTSRPADSEENMELELMEKDERIARLSSSLHTTDIAPQHSSILSHVGCMHRCTSIYRFLYYPISRAPPQYSQLSCVCVFSVLYVLPLNRSLPQPEPLLTVKLIWLDGHFV